MSALRLAVEDKSYRTAEGARPVIAGLRLEVEAGQFVCLFGPSGCGKTTLLNLVAGLDRDYDGRIEIGGTRGGRAPVLGYVFQTPRLLPWRTVEQNLRIAMGPEGDRELLDHLVRVAELGGHRRAFPNQLSAGLARRVALVRAFAVKPELLLMDEPFVSLDQPTADRLRTLLLTIWGARPTAVLFVTHDLREAIALADRICFLAPAPTRLLADRKVPLPRAERAGRALEELHARWRAEYDTELSAAARRAAGA